jgi:hypothetical protein
MTIEAPTSPIWEKRQVASTRAFGSDTLTLAGGSGTNLQDFKGLKDGVKRL